MGMSDKVWSALTTILKVNDKVVAMSGVMKEQQQRIEFLTERVIRLETSLELLTRDNLPRLDVASVTTKRLKK